MKNNLNLKVKIGDTTFKNPIWTASGTFGYAREFRNLLDLGKAGAIVAKTITLEGREGNRPPRMVETASGLLNSIGLENKGADHFKKEYYPFLKGLDTRIIISVAASLPEELKKFSGKFSGEDTPDAVELNLSCPNVTHGNTRYRLIAQDARATEKMTALLKRLMKCPVIAKLTPNVTDIGEIAKAAEAGGADAVSLVNTYPGMAVDAELMKPVLGNVTGGLSGPAIKPIALKAVWDAYNSVKIPVIGIGGIMNGTDAAEFMLCGASAVQIGTANFIDPAAQNRILEEFKEYLERKNIKSARALVGKLNE
ncbi:MAG: dihydroorotate dehydrogenase [Candidatus Omnitrophota bacterium]